MTPADMDRALRRAERALSGTTIEEAVQFNRVKAIIGARKHESEYPEQAIEALENLRAGIPPTPEQLAVLEAVVRAVRPAQLFRAGVPDLLSPDLDAVYPAWDSFRQQVGTGFLISDRVLVTNRHVVDELTRGTFALGPGQAVVRFRLEYDSPDSEAVDVERVIAVHETLDLALLEIAPVAAQPLTLAPIAAIEDDPVVVVGYPSSDPRNPVIGNAILGLRVGVKRASPGEVLSCRRSAAFHDCSTLGGNSGSPVLSFPEAKVIGVHAEGGFFYRNECVIVDELRAFSAPFLGG